MKGNYMSNHKTNAFTPESLSVVHSLLNNPQIGTYVNNMSRFVPQDLLTFDKYSNGKWKVLPYRCPHIRGNLVAALGECHPHPIKLPLNLSGIYHIFLGIWGYRWRAKLSSQNCYRECLVMCDMPHHTHFHYIHEVYFDTADITKQYLEFSTASSRAVGLAWIRLVPAEKNIKHTTPDLSVMVTNDCTYQQNAEEIYASLDPLKDTDVSKVILDCGLFGMRYKSDLPPHDTFIIDSHRNMLQFMHKVHQEGKDYLDYFAEYAEKIGLDYEYYLRLQEFAYTSETFKVMSPGCYETWEKSMRKILEAFDNYQCIHRDGRVTAQISYAYPQVRQYLLKKLDEFVATHKLSGFVLACHRSGPCVLYEEPVYQSYLAKTGKDIRHENELKEDVLACRADFFTEFVRGCKEVLEKANQQDGGCRTLSAFVLADRLSNLYYGFDVEKWCREKLIDSIILYPACIDFGFQNEIDTSDRPFERNRKNMGPSDRRLLTNVARIQIEVNVDNYDWGFYEYLKSQYCIKLYATAGTGFAYPRPIPFLEELRMIYSHDIDGILLWDGVSKMIDACSRPLAEYIGHKQWVLSLDSETVPSFARPILLNDLGNVAEDLFGGQIHC